MGLFTKTPLERFGPDLLDRLPLGVMILRLEREGDPRSLRLVYANRTAGRFAGLDAAAEVGSLLVEVAPGIDRAGLLGEYHGALRAGEPRDLGPLEYDDDRVAAGTYVIRAVPLAADALAVVFEDVEERAEVRQLREAEGLRVAEAARYRSLVEATAAIVWTTPPSGELQVDQAQWQAVTGQSAEESEGSGWLDAVHPDDREATATAWQEALRTEELYQVEHRLRQADGGYRQMAVRAVPVRDADGEVVEWVGVHTDVHAEAEAAAALAAGERRFRTLFDALDDVVLVYPVGPDGPGPFVAFNEAAVARYGYGRDELAQMTVSDLVADAGLDVDAAIAELLRSRRATFDTTHRTKSGQTIPMATSSKVVEYDGRLCVVSLCRDDADRRQFRREIARANRELEAAVAERTAQLEAFSEDLKILHEITTAEHPTRQARYDAYLEAGRRMFDLPIGILSATPRDEETGELLYRLEAVVSPDPSLERGLTVPLSEAFCDAVVEAGGTVTYADALDERPEHPACEGRGLRSFIGTPVTVDGELHGTLNFVSPEPRPSGFSASERDLIEVMAQAIGRRIEADHAEAAEAASREEYRTIVETVDSGVIVVDRDLRIVMSNPSARELLGLDMDPGHDGTGDLPDRWPVVDADGVRVAPGELPERVAFRTGEAVRGEIQGIVPPGEPVRWYRVNATPLDDDADGVPDSVVVSFHDVTDLRNVALASERSQDLLEAVLEASTEGVAAFRAVRGEGGRIEDFEWLTATPRAAGFVGKTPDDLVGQRLLEVHPELAGGELVRAYTRVVTEGVTFEDTVASVLEGEGTSYHVRAVPLGADDGLVVTYSKFVTAAVADVEVEVVEPLEGDA